MKVLLLAPSINPVTYKGLGRYCREIYQGTRHFADVDLVRKFSERDKVLSTHTQVRYRLLRSGRHDIVNALTPEMGIYSPFLCDGSVVTFHDLIPIVGYREMRFRLAFLIAYYVKMIFRMAAKAKRIIVNSTQTRNELVDSLNVNAQKIRVIPLGVDDRFKPAARKPSKRHTIGFFGNYTYRKRVDAAVSAFKVISQKIDANLILAGGEIQTIYQRYFDIQELIRGVEHVELLGQIPEEQLPELYNSFDVMLYPSMYKGFGLPILEAQRCGVPVLTLRDARIPEEVKKETVVCDDVLDMARKALDLLSDDGKRTALTRRATHYAVQFTWDRTVKETLDTYYELIW